jgi:hypothetical protein
VIFSQHNIILFNAFVLKVTNYLNIWIGTNGALDQMCREESVLIITADCSFFTFNCDGLFWDVA